MEREAIKEAAASIHAERRRDSLAAHGSYNRFNPISGDYDPAGIRKGMTGTAGQANGTGHSYADGFRSGGGSTFMHPQAHTYATASDPTEEVLLSRHALDRPYRGSRHIDERINYGKIQLRDSFYKL